uniref:Uncharacterized protein n=2 Tax=Panagrolaimus sp. JU765 TaxID=591449 RepID=A0AC34RMZ1_9BILA
MKLFILVSLLLFNGCYSQNCNYVTLVKCFINILDDWTWTLYELKDNVVTINDEQCQHLRQLDKCIQDEGPELHECTHSEIISASNTVSDLLTHRKNSGSFLKSYYLLTYACSQEGQELLKEHRSCLSKEQIGEMTLSAGTYLSEKFLEHSDEQVCPEVNNKLQGYMDALAGLCDDGAQQIMCRSLTNMFKGLHADKLHNCHFTCLKPSTTASSDEEETSVEGDHYSQEETAPESGSLNGAATTTLISSALTVLFITPFVLP